MSTLEHDNKYLPLAVCLAVVVLSQSFSNYVAISPPYLRKIAFKLENAYKINNFRPKRGDSLTLRNPDLNH